MHSSNPLNFVCVCPHCGLKPVLLCVKYLSSSVILHCFQDVSLFLGSSDL